VDDRAPASAAVELSNELLRAISDVLDVRDVFPRIAQTASQLLEHDCLDLVVQDRFGNAMLRSRSAQEFPEAPPALLADRGEFCVVRDLQEVASPDSGWEQRTFVDGLAAAGYQSFLCIRARARERVIRLGLFSRRRAAYTLDDVPVARLIADAIAVVVAHEQLAEAQRARVDARVQADGLDSRIRHLTELTRSTGCSSAGLTSDALEMLVGYEWRGNVRELHNALERAAILCQGGLITGEHLSLGATPFVVPTERRNLSDVEHQTIEQALRETDGNKSKAARRLGITRTQLYGRLRKYGFEPA